MATKGVKALPIEIRRHAGEQAGEFGVLVALAQALTGTDAKMGMAKPNQHGRAGEGGFVLALEIFAGLKEAQGLGSIDPAGFEQARYRTAR